MKVQLDTSDIAAACKRGIQLLESDSLQTPNAWNEDLVGLRILLASIMNGSYTLQPNVPGQTTEPVKLPPNQDATNGAGRDQPKAN